VSFDERFEEIRNAPVLILDDLGTQNATSWAQEKLYQVFNHRYNAQLSTVITTNQDLSDIDPRLRSRLLHIDFVEQVRILAPDFRGGFDRVQQPELSSLLLHRDQTFETFDLRKRELQPDEYDGLKEAFEIAKSYAAEPHDWLVFTSGYDGHYGSGKTHLAAAIANYRNDQGFPVLFVFVPDLLDHLRAAFNPQSQVRYDKRFDEVRTAPLLMLDDLGTESATPWAKEKLYQIINYRYVARLPTVVTTAYKIEELDLRLEARFSDTMRCTVIKIIAPPYRGKRPTKRK
jgi:DNA replication protein DnaC